MGKCFATKNHVRIQNLTLYPAEVFELPDGAEAEAERLLRLGAIVPVAGIEPVNDEQKEAQQVVSEEEKTKEATSNENISEEEETKDETSDENISAEEIPGQDEASEECSEAEPDPAIVDALEGIVTASKKPRSRKSGGKNK